MAFAYQSVFTKIQNKSLFLPFRNKTRLLVEIVTIGPQVDDKKTIFVSFLYEQVYYLFPQRQL